MADRRDQPTLLTDETLPPVPIADQIRCIERELMMRQAVYARRVRNGTMGQAQADEEIRRMKAVRDSLGRLAELEAEKRDTTDE